jgi:hypothetical protein
VDHVLILTSDILAEMNTLPPSDVSKHQDEIMYPLGVYENFSETNQPHEETENDMPMFIYSSLIHLRVILNRAHNTLYGASKLFDLRGSLPLTYYTQRDRDRLRSIPTT